MTPDIVIKADPDSPDVIRHYMLECSKCEVKILLPVIYYGPPHSRIGTPICGPCMIEHGLDPDWCRIHPEEANEIEAWIHETSS